VDAFSRPGDSGGSHGTGSAAAARKASDLRLTTNPDHMNALFAMTLGVGRQADHAGLIDKHQLGGAS